MFQSSNDVSCRGICWTILCISLCSRCDISKKNNRKASRPPRRVRPWNLVVPRPRQHRMWRALGTYLGNTTRATKSKTAKLTFLNRYPPRSNLRRCSQLKKQTKIKICASLVWTAYATVYSSIADISHCVWSVLPYSKRTTNLAPFVERSF